MNSTDVVALLALIVAVLAAGFALWQAIAAQNANKHASASADAARKSADAAVEANRLARISANAAKNQDMRDAERELRERNGWLIRPAGQDGAYALINVGSTTAYIQELSGESSPTFFEKPESLDSGASAKFYTSEDFDTSDRTITIAWTDIGGEYSKRVLHLP